MDGDGHADLLVAGWDGGEKLAVLIGNGSGGFRKAVRSDVTENFISGIATADLNGDGKLNVALTACCGLAANSYLIGKGNGHFKPEALLPTPISGRRPVLMDLNDDGRAEWLMSQPQHGSVLLKNVSQ